MPYVNVAKMKGWLKQSAKGNDYLSVALNIPDMDAFTDALEETEYGLRIRGSLFFEEDGDVSGSFSVRTDDEPKREPARKTRTAKSKTKSTAKFKMEPVDQDEEEWEDYDE